MTRVLVSRRPIRLARLLVTVVVLLAAVWLMSMSGDAMELGRPTIDSWRRTAQGWQRGFWTMPDRPPCHAPFHPAAAAALLAMIAAMALIGADHSRQPDRTRSNARMAPVTTPFTPGSVTRRGPLREHLAHSARQVARCHGGRHRRSSCPRLRCPEQS